MKILPFPYHTRLMDAKERDVVNALIEQYVDISNLLDAGVETTINAAINFLAQMTIEASIKAGRDKQAAKDWGAISGDIIVEVIDRNWDRIHKRQQK